MERGIETVSSPMPVLVTVHGSAPDCRPRNAKQLLKYKHAKTNTEIQEVAEEIKNLVDEREYLHITEWTVDDIKADVEWLGLSGSPTKVKKVENVILQSKEAKQINASDVELEDFIKELLENHTIG